MLRNLLQDYVMARLKPELDQFVSGLQISERECMNFVKGRSLHLPSGNKAPAKKNRLQTMEGGKGGQEDAIHEGQGDEAGD